MSERVCAVCAADGATVCSCEKTTPPTTEGPGERAALQEWDRLSLVVESAVRNADVFNHAAVVAAIKATRAALLSSPRVEEVRREALEEAALVAERGCLVPPDGGSPTEAEREMCEAIAASIRTLSTG